MLVFLLGVYTFQTHIDVYLVLLSCALAQSWTSSNLLIFP